MRLFSTLRRTAPELHACAGTRSGWEIDPGSYATTDGEGLMASIYPGKDCIQAPSQSSIILETPTLRSMPVTLRHEPGPLKTERLSFD